MRSHLLLIACLFVLSSSTCKKTSNENTSSADSILLHRSGGIAGLADYYMIYPDKVLKDTTKDQATIYDYPEPAKVTVGRQLLNNIPERMWQENHNTYGIAVADGIDFNVTAYKGGQKYEWVIRHNPPSYIQPYNQKMNDFFSR